MRLVAVLVLVGVGFLAPFAFGALASVVLYPVSVLRDWYQTSTDTLPQYLRTKEALIEEVDALRQELTNVSGTHLSISRLLEENMQLRAALDRSTTTERIMARVIAQPSRLNYDRLQIDQGSDAGVVVGAPVFYGFDTVIGSVVFVAREYALVDLVTSPGFTATAYILGPNTFAPLEGMGGGVARVKVPQGIGVRTGNIVLFPSVDSGVYGEIVSVENAPTQPEQYGYVTPPVSLQSLLYVSVGRSVPVTKDDAVVIETVREASRQYFRIENPPIIDEIASTSVGMTETTSSSSSP